MVVSASSADKIVSEDLDQQLGELLKTGSETMSHWDEPGNTPFVASKAVVENVAPSETLVSDIAGQTQDSKEIKVIDEFDSIFGDDEKVSTPPKQVSEKMGTVSKQPAAVSKQPVAVSKPLVAVATKTASEQLLHEARPHTAANAGEVAASKVDEDYDPPEETQTVTDFDFPANWHQPEGKAAPSPAQAQQAHHKAMQEIVTVTTLSTHTTGGSKAFHGALLKAPRVVKSDDLDGAFGDDDDNERVLPPMVVLPLLQATTPPEVVAARKASAKAEAERAKTKGAADKDWEGVAHQVLDELDKSKHGELVKMQTDRTKVIAPKAGGASKLGNADKVEEEYKSVMGPTQDYSKKAIFDDFTTPLHW